MSRQRKPAYTLHKATGQARVRINGKDHYLGRFGSPESRDEYDRLIGQWCRGQDHEAQRLTVDGLALLYVGHADQYYRKNGNPTGEARYCQKLTGRQKGLPSLALVSTFVRCAAEFDGSLAAASGRIGMIHR